MSAQIFDFCRQMADDERWAALWIMHPESWDSRAGDWSSPEWGVRFELWKNGFPVDIVQEPAKV